MTKANPTTWNAFPIFVKCLIIMFSTCAILVASQTVLSDRTSAKVAETAVTTLGNSITTISANQISGAVRFQDIDELRDRVGSILDGTDTAESALVLGQEGNVLLSLPDGIGEADLSTLSHHAATVIENGTAFTSSDGLLVIEPIRAGKDNTVVGAIAIRWNTQSLIEAVSDRRTTTLLISLASLAVMSFLAILAFRAIISRPLARITERTEALAHRDYATAIPMTHRGDEIGKTAAALETLRGKLEDAEVAKVDAFFKGAGFQASSAAMILCDEDLRISHVNKSFYDLAQEHLDDFRSRITEFDPDRLVGTSADIFHKDKESSRRMLASAKFPIKMDIKIGGMLLSLVINRIADAAGGTAGFVLEWDEVTDRRKSTAILKSLEAAQMRADFAPDGKLVALNQTMRDSFRLPAVTVPNAMLATFVSSGEVDDLLATVSGGQTVFGKFTVGHGGTESIVDGSLSPINDQNGRRIGFVLLGSDVTQSERRLREANETNQRMTAAQANVVAALQAALTALSQGNLRVRIDTEFSGDYEILRRDFNSAVIALDDAIGKILVSADTILAETSNVSGAADDLSRRTEQQAATLEETAAAISQLTASVASAASGAKQANDVVVEARDNAAASGEVVQQAVDAMGEIENSSDQISRIIGVIDEIAFQTNLLALNAGVEAARAGEAGRGFAVVASEVRALAQRSSEAASEITELISTSGEHVKKGVSLVDKAGHALTEIVASVGGIAEHVSSIAASAREQATGLDEINAAMNQLDQVTQKNVAMFEETTAASQTMTSEANALVAVTQRFDCSDATITLQSETTKHEAPATIHDSAARGDDMRALPADRDSQVHSETPRPEPDRNKQDIEPPADVAEPLDNAPKTHGKTGPQPAISGNLALAQDGPDEDDWEEF